MSNKDEKKTLKMYPGVSLGSAPRKSMSKLKVFLLIIIVVAGASAGGYWINREFINSEPEIPEVVEIVESDPQPTVTASQKNDDTTAADLDLTLTDEPATATDDTTVTVTTDTVAPAGYSNPVTTDTPDDLGLDQILEDTPAQDTETLTATDTSITETPDNTEQTSVKSEDTNFIDNTITAVTDTADAVSESVSEAVTSLTTSEMTPEQILAAIKDADSKIAGKDYKGAAAVLSSLTSLPADNLGKYAPDVYYRAGLANRYLKNEDEAQKNWLIAYKKYPETVPGRLSALALADTWYYWYVSAKPDITQWEKIRDAYSTAIGMDGARFLPKATDAQIAEKLNYLNEKLVFDPKMPVSGAIFHTVEPGEYISTIARKYGLDTWTSITEINKVDPKNLKVGMKLKIMTGRLFVLVDKRDFTLSWYLDGKFIKRYRCATGAVGSETPVGHYEIFKMDVEPNWTDPKTGKVYKYGEKGHAIGSRWLAIRGGSKTGLGIHGTIDPDSMGKKASNGCIRLLNKNVEELYGFASIANNNESEVLVIE